MFLRVCSTSLLTTLWKKEKLLIMSNFSFFHSVFYPFGELCIISSNLKLSSTNSSVWKSNACPLVKDKIPPENQRKKIPQIVNIIGRVEYYPKGVYRV